MFDVERVILSAASSLRQRPAELVAPAWLAHRMHDPSVRIVDLRSDRTTASPKSRRSRARGGLPACFLRSHIPGAVSLDAEALFDATGALISGLEFALAMSSVGVGDDHTVVLVDDAPGTVALAAAWALERYGHRGVRILEGGFARWTAERRPVTRELVRHPIASFTARISA